MYVRLPRHPIVVNSFFNIVCIYWVSMHVRSFVRGHYEWLKAGTLPMVLGAGGTTSVRSMKMRTCKRRPLNL